MTRTLLFFAAVTAAIVFACQPVQDDAQDASDDAPTAMSDEEKIEFGHRLVEMMDCNVCHSPKVMIDGVPVPDTTRLLMGYPSDRPLPEYDPSMVGPGKWALTGADHFQAWVGPWGTSFAANLTPDETGLGNWTFDHFRRAIREGKSKGLPNGRAILPPMPWPAYRHATDEELEAIFTYLKSIKPIRNVVPSPIPPAAPPS